MSLLPEIENGKLVPEKTGVFTPKPSIFRRGLKDEALLFELNNLDRPTVAKDFSDSPALNS